MEIARAADRLVTKHSFSIGDLGEARMRSTKYHLGLGYQVWNCEKAWYWLLISPHRNAGAIGAAVSQEQATRDACFSIEEMVGWPFPLAAASACGDRPALQRADSIACAKIHWEARLAQLQRYLNRLSSSIA
jgi:hypothetical protein